MSKDAYYFSHDANAHTDEKIIDLRMNHGWEGYGIYWAIIEMLRSASEYRLNTEYNRIAFALNTNSNTIKSIIEDHNLFVIEDESFYSESLMRRMKAKDAKSNKARENALKRWGKSSESNANASDSHSDGNANKRKGNEKKENKDTVEKDNIKVILDYLNEKTGKSFRTAKGLSSRFTEGYTVDDAKKVIDIKCAEWLHDPKMKTFLRPDTLFSGKFDGYLNQEQTVAKFNFDSAEWVTLNNGEKVKVDYDKLVVYDSKGSVHDFLEVDKEGTIFA